MTKFSSNVGDNLEFEKLQKDIDTALHRYFAARAEIKAPLNDAIVEGTYAAATLLWNVMNVVSGGKTSDTLHDCREALPYIGRMIADMAEVDDELVQAMRQASTATKN